MRVFLLASVISLLAPLSGTPAAAQSPSPLSRPNLALKTLGEVNALVRLPDGSLVMGGNFSSIEGEPRENLARLLPDGSLDPSWTPSTNGSVHALAADASGSVFVGGDFTQVGGLARNRIAKLAGAGTGDPDPDWNASANGRVSVLAFDVTTGALFAGGWFSEIGGYARASLAKLSTSGSGQADPQWNPAQPILVEEMVIVPGAVYAGGKGLNAPSTFGTLAKFASTGTGARFTEWTAARGSPDSLAVDPGSGALLVGGSGKIARLSSGTGAITAEWSLAGFGPLPITAMLIDGPGGTMHVGATYHLARMSTAGVVDTTWAPSVDGDVRALAFDSQGKVHAAGHFSQAGGAARLSAASFDALGAVGPAIDAERPGYANLLAIQPAGGVIVGGAFYKADGLTRRGLLRVAPDGTLDPDWNPGPGSDLVHALGVDPNSGDVYVGGEFTEIGGLTRYHLAKLSGDGVGAVDALWNPSPSGLIQEIVVDADGAVYVAGFFRWYFGTQSNIGGQRRDYLAKLAGTGIGAADPDWNPAPDGQVDALALDGNGGLLVGGLFGQIGGQPRASLARVAASGAAVVDPLWLSSANRHVSGLKLGADGWVYARGDFTTLGGLPRAGFGRISLAGGDVDVDWNPAPNSRVNGIAIDATGAIYAGGTFTQIGGGAHNYIARLSPAGSGAADTRWDPGVSAPGIATVDVESASGTVYAAGTFTHVGTEPRGGFVAIAPVLFSDGFETPAP